MSESPPPPNGPNGRDRLNLSLKDKSVGLVSNNLVTILLIALIGFVGYINWTARKEAGRQIQAALTMLDKRLEVFHDALDDNRFANLEVVHALREELRGHFETLQYNLHRESSEQIPYSLSPTVPVPQAPRAKRQP
jgi:hypothetical protein